MASLEHEAGCLVFNFMLSEAKHLLSSLRSNLTQAKSRSFASLRIKDPMIRSPDDSNSSRIRHVHAAHRCACHGNLRLLRNHNPGHNVRNEADPGEDRSNQPYQAQQRDIEVEVLGHAERNA